MQNYFLSFDFPAFLFGFVSSFRDIFVRSFMFSVSAIWRFFRLVVVDFVFLVSSSWVVYAVHDGWHFVMFMLASVTMNAWTSSQHVKQFRACILSTAHKTSKWADETGGENNERNGDGKSFETGESFKCSLRILRFSSWFSSSIFSIIFLFFVCYFFFSTTNCKFI